MVLILADPLSERVRRDGPRRALVDRGAGFWATWSDLHGLAVDWSHRLAAAGVAGGHRVAVVEPAGVRFAALMHACLRLGAALVPVSPRSPQPELERILADSRPRVLVRDAEVSELPDPARGDPDDAFVLYTSGTTGPAKGVRLTAANMAASAAGCQAALGGAEGDRWLLCLSPHHVGGLAILYRSALAGQPVISLDRFQPAPVLEAIRAERPALVSLVPTMLVQLLEAGGADDLRRLKAILVGGAPAPAGLVREWAALGLPVCPSYGLTETASQVAVVPPGRAAELAGASGLAHSGARISIEAGEVVVEGPVVSPGYLNPALAGPSGGSFRTGDAGRLDSEGVLWIEGRLDDAVITGGENVQPEEVEAVLRAHPDVADAAVVGRPDQTWGQVLEALVVPARPVAPEALGGWCRERLASFKVPRKITFVRSLPRSEGGKLLRREL